MQARIFLSAILFAGLVHAADDMPPALPEDLPPPVQERAAARDCRNCAVVQSIRSVERQRTDRRRIPNYMASQQYLDTRRYSEPFVGPVVGMTFGKGQETRRFVGAAGSNTMRESALEIVYLITVRFDDDRLATIEQDSVDGMRVGDRVEFVDERLRRASR